MTWWDWLIVSIVAWMATVTLLVALFAWRPPWRPALRPAVAGSVSRLF
ncbi:MAG: hypothetical protein ACXVRQ_02140 [Gaiellaceae bacterium]